jgi:peroxiredoxin
MPSVAPETFSSPLNVLSLPEIFTVISSGMKSGVLHVKTAQESLEVKFSFKRGRLGGVIGRNVPRTSETLLRLGVPNERVAQFVTGLTQGIESNTVPKEALERAMKLRAEIGLLPVWDNTNGSFEFTSMDTPPSFLEPGLKIESLGLDMARRLDELNRFGGDQLGHDQVFAAVGTSDYSKIQTQLNAADWAILNALDGTLTVAQIGSQTVMRFDDVARSIFKLEELGFIEDTQGKRSLSRKPVRLETGVIAPHFSLSAMDGKSFNLGMLRGRRTLLSFFRHAGCPMCNLRVHELKLAYPRLQAAGVSVVGVFGSSVESMRERVGSQQPPFPLLGDPDDLVHDLYGTQKSLFGFLNPKAFKSYLSGIQLGVKHGSPDGEALRMPADFLIGPDLRIERALYGSYGAEHLDISEIEQWGMMSLWVA